MHGIGPEGSKSNIYTVKSVKVRMYSVALDSENKKSLPAWLAAQAQKYF